MVSFQKDRSCQCRDNLEGLSPGHRRLRFSFQINDFKDPEPEDRPHRLAPGFGGGGDLVASDFRVKRFFRRRTSFRRPRPEAREAGVYRLAFLRQVALFEEEPLSSGPGPEAREAGVYRLISLRQVVLFEEEPLSAEPPPEGGGGGSLRKAVLRVNRAFQPFCGGEDRDLQDRKKPPSEAERLPSVFVSDDSIGARNLTKPLPKIKRLSLLSLRRDREAFVSAAPAAGPFPSEAAIYAAPFRAAT